MVRRGEDEMGEQGQRKEPVRRLLQSPGEKAEPKPGQQRAGDGLNTLGNLAWPLLVSSWK